MLKRKVIRRAKRFCKENNIDTYPVNIVELCEKQGFSVYELYLPSEVSGLIAIRDEPFKGYDTNKLILINLLDTASRRRFTIAHELAHYILHKPENENLYAHCDAGQNGGIEQEANIFASNILMPEKLVKEALDKINSGPGNSLFTSQKIRIITESFAVSSIMAQIRLEQLHLI